MDEHHEGVSLARHVLFFLQEVGDQLGAVWDEEVKVSVDRVDGQHCIAANVRVPVFQTGLDCWHQRLQQLRFLCQ